MIARFTSSTRLIASRLQPATTTRTRRTREVARKILAARGIGPAACVDGRSAAGRELTLEGLEVSRRNHEVTRLRMMEDEGRDRGLGIHHVALGQRHADRLLDVEQAEELLLILESWTGRVAEA